MAASTSSGRCLSSEPQRSQTPSTFGRLYRTWYVAPQCPHDRRPARRSTISASGTSMPITRSSAWPRFARILSRRSAWATVRGNPSRRKPSAASGLASLSSITSATGPSGTSSPRSTIAATLRPRGDPSRIAARNRSPVEMCGRPVRREISAACVPLPTPGAPRSTSLAPEPPTALIPSPAAAAHPRPLQEAVVVPHDELRFDLLHRVHGDADDDQERRPAEIELQAEPLRQERRQPRVQRRADERERLDVEPADQDLGEQRDHDEIDGSHERQTRQDLVQVFRRPPPGADSRDEAAVFLHVVGHVHRVEDDRDVEIAEEDDGHEVEEVVEGHGVVELVVQAGQPRLVL